MKIHLRKKSKNVKCLSERGFTMLEMLFSFSIFCLIASFLPLMFTIMFNYESVEGSIQKMEWELFVSQLKKEVQSSDTAEVVNGELTLFHGTQKTSFQQYRNLMRRRVDDRGHEVVLQNVEQVIFEKKGSSISVEVNDRFGKNHHATIFLFILGG